MNTEFIKGVVVPMPEGPVLDQSRHERSGADLTVYCCSAPT